MDNPKEVSSSETIASMFLKAISEHQCFEHGVTILTKWEAEIRKEERKQMGKLAE